LLWLRLRADVAQLIFVCDASVDVKIAGCFSFDNFGIEDIHYYWCQRSSFILSHHEQGTRRPRKLKLAMSSPSILQKWSHQTITLGILLPLLGYMIRCTVTQQQCKP